LNRIFSYVALPVEDLDRAFQFYSEITGGLIERNPNVPFPMAYFTDGNGNNVGHLFQLPNFNPSADGAIVYLEVDGDLSTTLLQIESTGGKVRMPKTSLGAGKGFWALFLDTEGNKLALHSTK